MALVFSLLFWGFLLVTSVLLFPLALLIRLATSLFDRRLMILHLFSCFWASLYTWSNPLWTVRIEGREKIPRSFPSVMVANHQSLVDILVLFRLMVHFKWVSKSENFRIPFIGWNMALNRYIRIDRGSVRGNIGMMRAATEALTQGSSVMIFPEGTRSPDGTVHPFKAGAFELALKTGCPILPIVIEGTAAALPKRGFILRGRQNIVVRVLSPVRIERFLAGGATAFAATVKEMVAGELSLMRKS